MIRLWSEGGRDGPSLALIATNRGKKGELSQNFRKEKARDPAYLQRERGGEPSRTNSCPQKEEGRFQSREKKSEKQVLLKHERRISKNPSEWTSGRQIEKISPILWTHDPEEKWKGIP